MATDPRSPSAILTFHSLDDSGSVISYNPDSFRIAMDALDESGIPIVSVREALRRPGSLALTFDDAFVNFATDAWPTLSRLRFPVTLFVVSKHAGAYNDWPGQLAGLPRLPLLDWALLRELAAAGVELGAHSHTHADLRQLAPAQLSEELSLPARLIEDKTGHRPTLFAYPSGLSTPTVRSHAAAFYEAACGTRLGYWTGREPLHDLPRLDAYYLRGYLGPASVFSQSGRRRLAIRAMMRRLREILHQP